MPTRGGEARVDEAVAREAEKRGWWAIKTTRLKIAGFPDWIVFCWEATTLVIECKAPTGRLSKIQKYVHEKLEALGFVIHVPRSPEEVQHIFHEHEKRVTGLFD